MPSSPSEHHRLSVVQAPVRPLDVDGLQAVTIGIALFAVATVVLVLVRDRLAAVGDTWWIGVGISGVVLGLIGMAYCARRRRMRTRDR